MDRVRVLIGIMDPVTFETHPTTYKHWSLQVDGAIARLTMAVDNDHPLRPGYDLKLNSYDLSVDIELADALQRVRFEHPEVRSVIVSADLDRVFCSGANIYMLGASTHSFKVNFCKFTNETRLYIEDASTHSGIKFLAACKGTTAGGGYELALACDDIVLVDDGSSAVSFPETPLLAVLPGTGGLTRLVDKRMVRRDRADVFCTLAEGIKGKRAVEWDLVDAVMPRSKFDDGVTERANELAKTVADVPHGPAVELTKLAPTIEDDKIAYEYVTVELARGERTATITMSSPSEAPPTGDAIAAAGANLWSLRAFRELDDAILRLRFNHPEIGVVLLRTSGNPAHVIAADKALADAAETMGFAREVLRFQARTLRRLDLTARSMFAVIDETSNCFAGSMLELALSADRVYMLEDDDEKVGVHTSIANAGSMPTSSGLSRLAVRFLGDPDKAKALLARGAEGMIPTTEADELGIATIAADDIDFEDELRIAVEERASLSPDALTGMEASLRFPGPETLETKIFGRLSAWQNWIFTRPNATGSQGALTLYGQPERPSFDWTRT